MAKEKMRNTSMRMNMEIYVEQWKEEENLA